MSNHRGIAMSDNGRPGHSVCDLCLSAAEEEGAEEDIAAEVMVTLGADVADHLCEEVESDGEIRCACACKRP